jgi:hypothetical protein
MTFYNKFDQRRIGKITASQVHILFPKRDNKKTQETYAKHLANEMRFGEIQSTESWQTKHGNDAEYHANNYFTEHYEFQVEFKPQFFEKGEFGGTPDAITEFYGIDYKCPTNLTKWLDYLHEGIDDQQYHQSQMYMWLTGKKLWKICVFLIENEFQAEPYNVEQDKRMIIIDIPYDETWSNDLSERSEYVLRKRDEYYQNLLKQFPIL